MRIGAAVNSDHEYALLGGRNRSLVGKYLGSLAALVSASIVFVLLSLVDVAKRFGLPVNLPPEIMSLVGAGTVYAILYWVFNRYGWKLYIVGLYLKLPDLSGKWRCEGITLNPDKSVQQSWRGEIIITQTWDRIRVHLATPTSRSNSITAALVDEIDGYRLLYSYQNDPKIDAKDLAAHRGVADLLFKKDLRTAEGEYFNGLGRFTFGTMQLTREQA